jgi:hypothetical protein
METRTILIAILVIFVVGLFAWLMLPSSTFAAKPDTTPKTFTQFDQTGFTTDAEGNYTGSFDSKILPQMTASQTNGSLEGYIVIKGTRTFFRGKISGVYTGRVYGSINQNSLSGAIKGNFENTTVSGAIESAVATPTPTAQGQQLDLNIILVIIAIIVVVAFAYMVWQNMQQRSYEDYESIEVVDGYVRPIIQKEYHREIKFLKGSKSIPVDKPKLRKLFYETFDGEIIMAFIYRGKIVDIQFNCTPARYVKELEEKHAFIRPYDDVNYGQMPRKKPYGRPAQRPLPRISKPGETEYRYSPDQKA